MMARCMCDLNREQQMLRKEGYIISRLNGITVENPRTRIVKGSTGDLLSLRNFGCELARARRTTRYRKKIQIAKAIEADNPLDDGLLARSQ